MEAAQQQEPFAGIGHNQPPEPTPQQIAVALLPETVVTGLTVKHVDLIKRVAEVMKDAETAPAEITNDIDQGKATETVKILRAVELLLEGERKKAKDPFSNAADAVDGFFNTRKTALEKLRKPLKEKTDAYTLKKEAEEKQRLEKIAQEKREAEQLALKRAQEAETALGDAQRQRAEAETLTKAADEARAAAQTEQETAAADLAIANADLAKLRSEALEIAASYKVKIRDGVAFDDAEREQKSTEMKEKIQKAKDKVTACEDLLKIAREKARKAKKDQEDREAAQAAANKQVRVATSAVNTNLNEAVRHGSAAGKIEAKAEGKPGDRARTLSEHGGISTAALEWKYSIIDQAKLDKEKLWPFISEEVKRIALGHWMRAQPETKEARQMSGAYIAQEISPENHVKGTVVVAEEKQSDTKEVEVLSELPPGYEASTQALAVQLTKAEVDVQITTAKAYPRSVQRAINNIVALATLDQQTALECVYGLPRGDKVIKGPSIRLAEIIFSQWGNCRAAARVVHVDRNEKFIEAEGIFYDLETNAATTARRRSRIVDKYGKIYNDDMIIMTGNAACSIAKRNAILGGVPKGVWRSGYENAVFVIAGDIKTIAARRSEALKQFAVLGVKQDQIFTKLGITGEADINGDKFVSLIAMYQTLKSGEETIETMFSDGATGAGPSQTARPDRKNYKGGKKPEAKGETAAAAAKKSDQKPQSGATEDKVPSGDAAGAPGGEGSKPDPPGATSSGQKPSEDAAAKAEEDGYAHAKEGRNMRAMPAEYRDDLILSDAYKKGFAKFQQEQAQG